jgi:hypothetical protein
VNQDEAVVAPGVDPVLPLNPTSLFETHGLVMFAYAARRLGAALAEDIVGGDLSLSHRRRWPVRSLSGKRAGLAGSAAIAADEVTDSLRRHARPLLI